MGPGEARLGRVIWVEPAPLMFGTVVDFVRTRDGSREALRPEDETDLLLGVLDLRSGSRMWCFRREVALAPRDSGWWQAQLASTTLTVGGPVRDGEVFSLYQSPGGDLPWPTVREAAMGLGNFRSRDQGE